MVDHNCLFCKIGLGEVPAKKVYENNDLLAFEDINPQAPVHLLIIPKRHIASLHVVEEADRLLLGQLLTTASDLAKKHDLHRGYRVVINSLSDAGQAVDHLHVHLLGGRKMSWPPG